MQPSHTPIYTPLIKTSKKYIFKKIQGEEKSFCFSCTNCSLYPLNSQCFHSLCWALSSHSVTPSVPDNLYHGQSVPSPPIAQQHHLYYMLIISVVFGRKYKFVSDFSYPLTYTYSVFNLE